MSAVIKSAVLLAPFFQGDLLSVSVSPQARDEVSQHEKIVSMDRENAVLSGCCQTKSGSGAVRSKSLI